MNICFRLVHLTMTLCILIFVSSGFAAEDTQDRVVPESNGAFRGLQCGTEKEKHKCKNFRTAGILVSLSKIT